MSKLVGQDTSKSITGFSKTSPGQSGKNFNTSNTPAPTSQEFKSGYKSKGIGSSSEFGKDGKQKNSASLGNKFLKLANARNRTKVATLQPGKKSGKANLNKVF